MYIYIYIYISIYIYIYRYTYNEYINIRVELNTIKNQTEFEPMEKQIAGGKYNTSSVVFAVSSNGGWGK